MKIKILILAMAPIFLPGIILAQSTGSSSSDGSAGSVPVATAQATINPTQRTTPSLLTSPATSQTPIVSISIAPVAGNTAASSSNNFGLVAGASVAVIGLGALGLGFLRKNGQQKDKKEENRCDSIKDLLEQKKQELEDMVRDWPEEKLKEIAKDKTMGVLGKNENVGKAIDVTEDVKAKYDKLQETIEILENKFNLCMLSLNLGSKKRVFMIHGWTGKPNQHWMPWLAKNLEQNGFEVYQPEMPETDMPRMEAWVSHLKKQVGVADQDTYFVGHSIGCLTILRYLEKYGESIAGAILVAPWITLNPESFTAPEDKSVVEEWTENQLDWQKIKEFCPDFVAIFSKDDQDVPFVENEAVFRNKLEAKIIVEENMGHFTTDDGVTELPSALEAIMALRN